MTIKLSALALGAMALAAPLAGASAQKVSGAQIAVVDVRRIYAECTACKAATTQLQAQAASAQQRQQLLRQQIETEAAAIRTALGGKDPDAADAATKKRIEAFQQKQGAAQQEMQGREQTLQRNQAYVLQQINAKLTPIFQTVAAARGANLMVDAQATLWNAPALDVTNDVLAQVNAQLPSVGTTAPAAPAPQGR